MAVVLYFFADPESDRVRSDLRLLAAQQPALKEQSATILGISPAKQPALKQLQRDLELPFPLLTDDRKFSLAYGVGTDSEETEAEPALMLVDRRQRIAWQANPATSVDEALAELEKVLAGLPSPISNYPRSVINRLVTRFVS
ncbi:MAG: redoxin domain-containing protein [Acidobacteria bacterium]|nr:MAG: redoxin domain-containing protein [Acidobacteriota bacterium]